MNKDILKQMTNNASKTLGFKDIFTLFLWRFVGKSRLGVFTIKLSWGMIASVAIAQTKEMTKSELRQFITAHGQEAIDKLS